MLVELLHLLNFDELSSELFRRNRGLLVQMDTTMEFISSSSTSWCGELLDSDVGSIIFPNSGEPFRRYY
jgi:hypothetical protein